MYVALLLAQLMAAQTYQASESCSILYVGQDDQWRFIKIFDAGSGKEIMSSVVRAGKPKGIYMAPPRIRIEFKYAGELAYSPGPTADCSAGNVIRI